VLAGRPGFDKLSLRMSHASIISESVKNSTGKQTARNPEDIPILVVCLTIVVPECKMLDK
jgi:hypothetical protein